MKEYFESTEYKESEKDLLGLSFSEEDSEYIKNNIEESGMQDIFVLNKDDDKKKNEIIENQFELSFLSVNGKGSKEDDILLFNGEKISEQKNIRTNVFEISFEEENEPEAGKGSPKDIINNENGKMKASKQIINDEFGISFEEEEKPPREKKTDTFIEQIHKENEQAHQEKARLDKEKEKKKKKFEETKMSEEKEKSARKRNVRKKRNGQKKEREKEKNANKRKPKEHTNAESITKKQADEINILKRLSKKLDRGLHLDAEWTGRVPSSFRVFQKNLMKLDAFMKQIKGRSRLTTEEMETYEKLSLKVCTSAQTYLNKKQKERDDRFIRGKKESRGEYEELRIRGAREIMESVQKMREEMFESQMKEREETTKTECEKKAAEVEERLEKLSGKNLEDKDLEKELEKTITEAVFYSHRMDSLKKDFNVKRSESFDSAMNRLDRSLELRQIDMDNIKKNELTKKMVEEGMKKIHQGENFGMDDIKKMEKQYIKKLAEKKVRLERRNSERNRQRVAGQEQKQIGQSKNKQNRAKQKRQKRFAGKEKGSIDLVAQNYHGRQMS